MRRNLMIAVSVMVFLFGTLGFANATQINVSNILSDWTPTYDFYTNANNAIWQNSGGNLWNGGNRVGSIISDFTTIGDYSFNASLYAAGDNDLMGLVFGWQDHNNTYSLSWGGGGVGAANGIHVYKEQNGIRSSLAVSSVNWSSGKWYDFSVVKSGNQYSLGIDLGTTNIFSTIVSDSTFSTGEIGFHTWSQSTFVGANSIDYTTSTNPTPEPNTMFLLGAGLIGLAGFRRRFKKS